MLPRLIPQTSRARARFTPAEHVSSREAQPSAELFGEATDVAGVA